MRIFLFFASVLCAFSSHASTVHDVLLDTSQAPQGFKRVTFLMGENNVIQTTARETKTYHLDHRFSANPKEKSQFFPKNVIGNRFVVDPTLAKEEKFNGIIKTFVEFSDGGVTEASTITSHAYDAIKDFQGKVRLCLTLTGHSPTVHFEKM